LNIMYYYYPKPQLAEIELLPTKKS